MKINRLTTQYSFYYNYQILATTLQNFFNIYKVYVSRFLFRLVQNLKILLPKVLRSRSNQKGLIALISILVISSVVLLITISLSWYSTAELQMSWWTNQSQIAYELAESCMEDGLNALRLSWEDYDASLSIGGDSCIISVVTSIDEATVTSTATVDDITRSIVATIDTSLEFTSWQEN